MALHLAPGVKAVPSNAAAFHVAHTPFILPFGLRSVRPAGLWRETPMPGKGGKGGVDHQFSSSGVVQGDQRPGVVDQHLLRHPLPEAECLLQRLQPVALLLLPIHPDHLPPRVSERQYAEVHFGPHPADRHPQLTEVSLQLLSGPRFVAHRRLSALPQRLPPGLHRPLHRPLTHTDPLLFQQLLPQHLGVAVVLLELLLQPLPVAIELAGAIGCAVRLPLPQGQVSVHRVTRDAQLRRDPPAAPATLQQLAYHRHLLWGFHHALQRDHPHCCMRAGHLG